MLIAAGVTAVAVLIVAAIAVGGSLGKKVSGAAPGTPGESAAPSAATTQPDAQLERAESTFATSYSAYLYGAPIAAVQAVSVTARAQAISGGRIPPAFRDGPLTVSSVSTAGGPFAAVATIVLANREERYRLVVQLLRPRRGWEVAQLQPPDLTIDETVRPAEGVRIPAAAQDATRRFVIAYAAYRAGARAFPLGETSDAAAAMRGRSDTLASVRLPLGAPRLVSLRFGPLSGGEFAATATVAFGAGAGAEQAFSLLMQLQQQTGGWLCAAFL